MSVHNGDSQRDDPPVKELQVTVAGDQVTASLRRGEELERGPEFCDLDLEPRRKSSIDLLTKFLRMAMDANRLDWLEKDLYKALLEALGRELFDLLLRGNVAELVREQLRQVRRKELRLRITLIFATVETPKDHSKWLSSLPWEYIHTPHGDSSLGEKGAFLSSQAELILSRRVAGEGRSFGEDPRPITVLVVCASPTQPDNEKNTLSRVVPGAMLPALRELEQEGFIRLVELIDRNPPRAGETTEDYVWEALPSEFDRLVSEENPVLIHFIGHGQHLDGRGELAFSRRNGKPYWVPEDWFAQTAGQLRGLKAVFLQACESARTDPYVAFSGVAATLAGAGVPAVIGMQYVVAADTATTFACAMYRALAADLTIDMAVKAGRAALTAEPSVWEDLCFGLPVLYLSQYKAIAPRGARLGPRQPSFGTGTSEPGRARTCGRCGADLLPHAKFCGECGFRLPRFCSNCGYRFLGSPPSECPECHEPTSASYRDTVLEVGEELPIQRPDIVAAFQGPGPDA